MTDETEISTPVDTETDDTSTIVEPDNGSDTSTVEPDVTDNAAETETNAGQTDEQAQTEQLYAGKYKSVDELVSGYNEAQKYVTKAAELEKKYNELVSKQEAEAQKIANERLEQAQRRGFRTVEQQEIADKVQVAELEYYVANLNQVLPEHTETVRQCLQAYYQTANKAYLDEAKRYFSSDFIENVALAKTNLEQQLTAQYQNAQNEKLNQQSQELANSLKADFADFLADLDANEGKAQALKSFCHVGSINSKEDMQVFSDIYSKIAEYERAQAIKEYEAAKVIEETKNKAVIEAGAAVDTSSGLKDTYSEDEVYKMNPDEFDKLYTKYGTEFTKRIK